MERTKLETAAANYTYLRGLFFIPLGVLPILSWGIVLAVGAIPLWDGADPSNIGLAIVGVALMLNGVFDHLLFVRTFGAPTSLDGKDDNA